MARVSYAPEARADLIRLVGFLIQAGAADPAAMADDVASAVEILIRHPKIGRPLESGLRELVISRGASGYLALYDYSELHDDVLILRIRHQREEDYH